MLPARALARAAARAAALRPRAVHAMAVRLQHSAAGETAAENGAKPAKTAQAAKSGPPDGEMGKRKPYFNRKVRDIAAQVKASVDATPAELLSEAVEILEEGVSYLREIQSAEKIPEPVLYSVFQPLATAVMEKAVAGNAVGASPQEILEMLMLHHIAHAYHFILVQAAELRAGASEDAYARALQWWVRYLEYANGVEGLRRRLSVPNGPYEKNQYDFRDLVNTTYFAYVLHCLATGAPCTMRDAMKLLQTKDGVALPAAMFVRNSLNRAQLYEPLHDAYAAYTAWLKESAVHLMDPNGAFVVLRIERAMLTGNVNALHTLYAQMQQASVANSMPLKEGTLNRVMKAYIELHRFADALDIFRVMLATKVLPSPNTWDLVIKALGHPLNVPEGKPARDAAADRIAQTVQTMLASGGKVSARTLAVVVGAYANLDRMDLAEEFMAAHRDVPVVHLARSNILIGMVINKHVGDAEATMKKYTEEDASYTPSTGVVNAFLAHYVSANNDAAVENLLRYMRDHGIEEDTATTTTILHYYFRTFRNKGRVPDIGELLTMLQAGNASAPLNLRTVAVLLDGLTKDGLNMDAARALFDHLGKDRALQRMRYDAGLVTTMIRAELEFGSVHAAQDLFDHYVAQLRNDTRIWNMMVTSFLTKSESVALDYYRRLCEQRPFGVAPNHFTYYFLLDHFVKTGNAARVQWVLDELAQAQLPELGTRLPRRVYGLRGSYTVARDLLQRVTPSL